MSESKLKIGDYVIALEDLIIPGTEATYYIYKGKYYKITEISNFSGYFYHIVSIMNRRERRELYRKDNRKYYDYYFSETELFQKFDCNFQRREKLKRLKKISNEI